jgi:uncharacterized membrane protein
MVIVIIGLVVGIAVALIIIQLVLTVQNNLEEAGLRLTKLEEGLLFSR